MATLPVAIDARGAVAGAGVFNKATQSMGFHAKGAQGAIKGLIGVLAAFTAVKAAVKTMSDFELTMRKVQGVTGQTTREMKAMTQVARELGATTQFTATQAGEGLLFLSRAGFSANESMTALPATLNLAAAAGLELGFAADLASNVLRQFSLEASETVRVVDALLRVSNQANTDVRQLGEAMKFAGPIAGALGKTVEETAVLIGLLGDAGIQASMAGTNLRGVMLALSAPTEGAKNAMEDLGLSFKELQPDANSMESIFRKFQKAGISAGQASQIFGRRNAAAGLILSGSSSRIEANVAALEEMNDASTIAGQIMDTLSGSMKEFVSAVQEAFLVTGESGFAGGLRSIVDIGTDLVRTMAGVEGALKNNETAIKGVVFVLKVLAVRWAILTTGKILIWLKGVALGLWASTRAMLGFNAAVAANPIGLLTTALAGAIVWLIDFNSKLAASARHVENMTDRLREYTKAAEEAGNAGDVSFFDFGGRIKTVSRSLKFLEDQLKDVKGQIEKGTLAFDPKGLGQLTGLDFPTRQIGLPGNEKEIVTAKQAILTIEIQIERWKEGIKLIKEQQKAYQNQTATTLKANEAEEDRLKLIGSSITAVQNEIDQVKFQESLRGQSISQMAKLNAERKIAIAFSKVQSQLTQAEQEEFHELGEVLVELAVAFGKVQEAAAVKDFNTSLQAQANAAKLTADEMEILAVRQDAYNVAVRAGIEDVAGFTKKAEDQIKAIQAQRQATDEAREATEAWAQTASQGLDMVLDGIVDIIVEGKKAEDVVKSLIKEISKLVLKQALLRVASQIGGSFGGGGSPGPALAQGDGTFKFAKGGLLNDGHVQRFQHGGLLVNEPTAFPRGVNLIAEAGKPEYVVPAVRNRGGRLVPDASGFGGPNGGGDTVNDNRRFTFHQTFFDKARDSDSFRRNDKQILRDARDRMNS